MSERLRAELEKHGYSKTIKLAALAAGVKVQYDREHADIRPGIKKYGSYNTITIMNMSTACPLEVQLDYSPDKILIVPPSTTIGKDEIVFQEFNVINKHASTTVAVSEVSIVIAYEPPEIRDRRKPIGGR